MSKPVRTYALPDCFDSESPAVAFVRAREGTRRYSREKGRDSQRFMRTYPRQAAGWETRRVATRRPTLALTCAWARARVHTPRRFPDATTFPAERKNPKKGQCLIYDATFNLTPRPLPPLPLTLWVRATRFLIGGEFPPCPKFVINFDHALAPFFAGARAFTRVPRAGIVKQRNHEEPHGKDGYRSATWPSTTAGFRRVTFRDRLGESR